MLHLQKHLRISLNHQWSFFVNRFATTAASKASPDPTPFSIQNYLVATCGLTRDKAVKASKMIPHVKSQLNAESVLSFLMGIGLSPSDIASAVARDPRLLCCNVEKVLAPRLAELQNYGLSNSQIARFLMTDPSFLRRSSIVSKLQFYIPLFGSIDKLLLALRRSTYLLGANLERVVKPNISLLSDYGLGASDITRVCLNRPRLLCYPSSRVEEMMACADAFGIRRGEPMFALVLSCVAFLTKDGVAAKMEILKKAMQCSDAEVITAVCKAPTLLTSTEDRIHRLSGFLISEAGFDPKYIASNPVLMTYSLERRLRPRFYVLKFLEEKGLLGSKRSYYSAVMLKEKDFVERFIHRYIEAAPLLAEDYAASCKGQVSPRLKSQDSSAGLASV